MKEVLRPAIVSLLAFTILLGIAYPLVMDGVAGALFAHQATGSLLRDRQGHVVGSELIGQPFDNPAYFWSRPTADANYDAASSVATNQGQSAFIDDKGHLGPNPTLAKTAKDRIDALHTADPDNIAASPGRPRDVVGLGPRPAHLAGLGVLPGRARRADARAVRGDDPATRRRARRAAHVRDPRRAPSERLAA